MYLCTTFSRKVLEYLQEVLRFGRLVSAAPQACAVSGRDALDILHWETFPSHVKGMAPLRILTPLFGGEEHR